jgi:hypothetical protein
MDITKIFLTLLATILLIACGSDSDNSTSTEIIFPEHLPKVNPNLSQENQSGIWMVYRVTTESSEYTNGDGEIVNIEKEIVANELGTMVLDIEDDYSDALNCISSNFTLDPNYLVRHIHDQGYTELYRNNMNEEYGSSGLIAVSYLSSQKIHGQGWRMHQYLVNGVTTGFRQEIEFFAVKVSDEDNFSLSDDLDYFSTINSENNNFDGDQFYQGACFGLQKHHYSSKIGNVTVDSYTSENFVHYGNYDHTFEIYNGKSDNTKSENIQVIGVQRLGFHKSIDHHCLESEAECLNSLSLDTEILQNDSSGISFTAKLTGNEDLNNEVYIDAQVSVIIHPFEPAETSQE